MRGILLLVASVVAFLTVGYLFMPEDTTDRSPSATGRIDMIPVTFPNFAEARQLRVYLPEGYSQSEDSYPVIYMQDGQNLYDKSTGYAGEWQVDETLAKLQSAGKTNGVIVVGIDNAGSGRMSEYAPWDFMFKKFRYIGHGDGYVDHLATVIKPMIDEKYRTKPEPQHTAIMGSSMGGLVSLYGGLRHPTVFGKVAALSSTLRADVVGDRMMNYARLKAAVGPRQIYMDIGDGETNAENKIAERTQQIAKEIKGLAGKDAKITFKLIKGATHSEASWAKRFGDIVLWLDLE